MEKIEIFAKLSQISVQTRWLHQQTESYEEHKTLDIFYTEWSSLTDQFIEIYFGKYGRKNGRFINLIKGYNEISSTDMVNEAYDFVSNELKSIVAPECVDLLNIIADMQGLCNHTKYLLTLK